MGYLTDNIPPGRNYAYCQDLYLYRMIVDPAFASDVKLQQIVQDEIPDVEEWQFSGRRRCPVVPSRGPARKAQGRVVHPATWAEDSRLVRPFTAEVVFAFRTTAQRDQVGARMTQEGFKFRLENEPS